MTEWIPASPLLAAFIIASFVLAITPGPGVIYVVTRTLAQGRKAGLASLVGVALGNLGNAIGASLGLAVLFAISSFAFMFVKYAGAAYLIYLGIQAMLTPANGIRIESPSAANMKKLFRDGLVVALLNPKTTIFFAAFLPQFMSPDAPPMPQSILLGTIFVAIAVLTDSLYVLMASIVGPALSRLQVARAFGRYLTASAFIGLGIFTAVTGTRSDPK